VVEGAPTSSYARRPRRAPWPPELDEVFERCIAAEYATLTRAGRPITVPSTPYVGNDEQTLDVSTGLTYPAKAERARRDPRVALLFADPIGRGVAGTPVALVQGLATVRDSDLQANTDRYVARSGAKLPEVTKGQPRFVLRRLAWYYARIWIEVTPLHIRWWPSRQLTETPRTWNAPEGTAAPLSDPAPSGSQPEPWVTPPASWQAVMRDGAGLPVHDLTVVDGNGFPLCIPVSRTEVTEDGARLSVGPAAPGFSGGPACITMHGHADVFMGQQNRTVVGTVEPWEPGAGPVSLRAERGLADWSLAGNKARSALSLLSKRRLLAPRLQAEADRRFQPVPEVRFPPSR
jgi:hypothetical protein